MNERPKTRAECPPIGANGWRECAWAGCRHHLYLDVTSTGRLQIKHAQPLEDLWEVQPVCSLDVAERGDHTLEEVGAFLGVNRERVRQIEVAGMAATRRREEMPAIMELAGVGEQSARQEVEEAPPLQWADLGWNQRLRVLREAAGLSRAALAAQIGAASSTLKSIEAGQKTLHAPTVQAMLAALGVTRADLSASAPPTQGADNWQRLALGERLRWLRKERGLTQWQVAVLMGGLSGRQVGAIEMGSACSDRHLGAMARALEVSIEAIESPVRPKLKPSDVAERVKRADTSAPWSALPLGRRMALVRLSLGLTQKQLGERVGLSRRLIAHVESGTMSEERRDLVLGALGVTLKQMQGDTQPEVA